jgi:putative drug exporter of the RND superfamily
MRHRGWVLSGWGIGCVILAVLAVSMGARILNFVWVPGFESSTEAARWSLNERNGDNAFFIFHAPEGITAPEVRPRVEMLAVAAAQLDGTIGVVSPFDNPGQISNDGGIAYSIVQFEGSAAEIDPSAVDQLLELADGASGHGLNVVVSGSLVEAYDMQSPDSAAISGFALTLVILLLAFGTVMAMALPVVASLAALAAGFLLVAIVTPIIDVSQLVPAFALMVGIGFSIDYALYIVDRVRQNRAAGLETEDAVVAALDSSGRAVLFAGALALIPLAGLFIVGASFVAALGVAGIIVIITGVLATMTFLPALLSYFANDLERWKIPKLYKPPDSGAKSTPYKVASRALEHPLCWVILLTTVLLVAMIPLLNIDLSFSRSGDNPISVHSGERQALLDLGFGEGFTGPFILTVDLNGALDQSLMEDLKAAIAADEGVAVTSAIVYDRDMRSAVLTVLPAGEPQDDEVRETLQRLRNDVVPAIVAGPDHEIIVGGPPANLMDIATTLNDRMLLYILVSVVGTVLLLMAVFRSILLPIKAVLLSALSTGASLGVMVAVVQWGFVGQWLGTIDTGPIEPYVPVMLFALLFGISLNYEVFLLSRVREAFIEHGDSDRALREGLASTARFMAAAAAIMTRVFSAFLVMGGSRATQQLGLALGIAVFIDVMLVRFVLVPATMKLAEGWNWWMPGWLDRLLPSFHIEPNAHSTQPDGAPDPATTD